MGNPLHGYRASPAIWYDSVTCISHKVTALRFNPSQTGQYLIYLSRRDGRLSWPGWLYWCLTFTSSNDFFAGVESSGLAICSDRVQVWCSVCITDSDRNTDWHAPQFRHTCFGNWRVSLNVQLCVSFLFSTFLLQRNPT